MLLLCFIPLLAKNNNNHNKLEQLERLSFCSADLKIECKNVTNEIVLLFMNCDNYAHSLLSQI